MWNSLTFFHVESAQRTGVRDVNSFGLRDNKRRCSFTTVSSLESSETTKNRKNTLKTRLKHTLIFL